IRNSNFGNLILRIFLILLIVAKGFAGMGQQTPLFTHYMFTNMFYNPGFAGSSEGISVTGLVRQQWIGFKSDDGSSPAPQIFLLTIDSPLKFLHGGVAGSVTQDKIGQFSNINVKLGYAYRAELGSGTLGAGLQVSLMNIKLDFSKFDPIQDGDPALTPKNKVNDFIIDLSLGAFYKVPEKYYIGLSVDNLLQTKGPQTFYQLRRQYFLTGGYYYPIPGHAIFELQPSAFMAYDGAVFQFGIGGLVEYNKKVWGGLEYRYQDALSLMAGMNIKSIRIGLAYDIATSWMSNHSSGSVELMLNYVFKIQTEKFRKSYKNTRFL
ncbi:MAG: type IX secretion system membrane protein PorP/SprF, partial [Bacteroidota bacterium]